MRWSVQSVAAVCAAAVVAGAVIVAGWGLLRPGDEAAASTPISAQDAIANAGRRVLRDQADDRAYRRRYGAYSRSAAGRNRGAPDGTQSRQDPVGSQAGAGTRPAEDPGNRTAAEEIDRLIREILEAPKGRRMQLLMDLGKALADSETGDLGFLTAITGQLASDDDVRYLMRSYFHRLGEIDPRLGIALAGQVGERLRMVTTQGTRYVFSPLEAMRETVRGWASVDLPAAARWAGELPSTVRERYALQTEIVTAWAKVDSQGAVQWALELGTGNDGQVEYAARLWASRDMGAALGFLNGIEAGRSRDMFIQGLIPTLGRDSPNQALALLQTVTPGSARDNATLGLLRGLAHSDPAGAAQWALALLEPRRLSSALDSVASSWVRKDAAAAAAFISSLEDVALRDRMWQSGAVALAATDPESAYAWLVQIQGDTARAQAVERMVARWARGDPAGAAAWAARLDDPTTRGMAYANVALQWGRRDRDATERWLQSLPDEPARYSAILAYTATHIDFPDQASLSAWRNVMRRPALTRADVTAWLASSGLSEDLRRELSGLF